jgi:hypothetical protein
MANRTITWAAITRNFSNHPLGSKETQNPTHWNFLGHTCFIGGKSTGKHHFEDTKPYDTFYKGTPIAHLASINMDAASNPEHPELLPCLLDPHSVILTEKLLGKPNQAAKDMENLWHPILSQTHFPAFNIREPGAVFMDEHGKDFMAMKANPKFLKDTWKKEKLADRQATIRTLIIKTLEDRTLNTLKTQLETSMAALALESGQTSETTEKILNNLRSETLEKLSNPKRFTDRTKANIAFVNMLNHPGQTTQETSATPTPATDKTAFRQALDQHIKSLKDTPQETFSHWTIHQLAEKHGLDTGKPVDGLLSEAIKAQTELTNRYTPDPNEKDLNALEKQLNALDAQKQATRSETATLTEETKLNPAEFAEWQDAKTKAINQNASIIPLSTTIWLPIDHAKPDHPTDPDKTTWLTLKEFKDTVDSLLSVFPQLNRHALPLQKKDFASLQGNTAWKPNGLSDSLVLTLFTTMLSWKDTTPAQNLDNMPVPSQETENPPEISFKHNLQTKANLTAKLQLLTDRILNIYNPVFNKETNPKQALIWRPSIISRGIENTAKNLANLGYILKTNPETNRKIERKRLQSETNSIPNRELSGIETLAYYNHSQYVAQATLKDPNGILIWKKGKNYLITPGWEQKREIIAKTKFEIETERTGEETRTILFQYTYWDVETETGTVRIPETHSRADIEIEDSITANPNAQTNTPNTLPDTTPEEMAEIEEERLLLARITLNPPQPNRPWQPCLDEFLQVFPPAGPLPIMLTHEAEIKELMKRALSRFGPCHTRRENIGKKPSDAVLSRAKQLASENGDAWDSLPDFDPTPVTLQFNRDKAGYLDQAEGRLPSIPPYQLREAAIGAIKKNVLNTSIPGSGKTIMSLMQCHLMRLKQVYVVTAAKLLPTWERECKRLNLPVHYIKSPSDAKKLAGKIAENRKNPNYTGELEFYLISAEWVCLGSKQNCIFLPWWSSHPLHPDHNRLFQKIGEWLSTKPEYTHFSQNHLQGLQWMKDPNRPMVNSTGVPLTQHITATMGKDWVIDLERLTYFIDRQNQPDARVKINPDDLTVSVLSEDDNAKNALEKTELRIINNRRTRYQTLVTKCPNCNAESPQWKNHHCSACGFDPRYYSVKPDGAATLKINNPESEYARLAAQPRTFSKFDIKNKHLEKFVSLKRRSNRSFPGYRLLPRVSGMIVDEFHNLVSFRTLHGRAIFDIPAKHVILTSGTLCRTRIAQMEPALALIHEPNSPEFPYARHTMTNFRERYNTFEETETLIGTKTKNSKKENPEPSNTLSLRRLLHGRIIGIDEKTMETQWNLPQIREQLIRFTLNTTEADAYQKHRLQILQWKAGLEEIIQNGNYQEIREARKQLITGARQHTNLLREICNGGTKVQAALNWATRHHQNDRRFIMVCKSTKLFADMEAALRQSGIPITSIDEKTDAESRDEILNQWREGSTHLLSRIKLICEGYNQMTCATHLLFLETEDSPAHNRQMQKRLNRIGQTQQVTCDFLIAVQPDGKKTADEAAILNFIRREKAIAQITDRNAAALYKGPDTIINEFQAANGALRIIEDITNEKMSEILEETLIESQQETPAAAKTQTQPPPTPGKQAVWQMILNCTTDPAPTPKTHRIRMRKPVVPPNSQLLLIPNE